MELMRPSLLAAVSPPWAGAWQGQRLEEQSVVQAEHSIGSRWDASSCSTVVAPDLDMGASGPKAPGCCSQPWEGRQESRGV